MSVRASMRPSRPRPNSDVVTIKRNNAIAVCVLRSHYAVARVLLVVLWYLDEAYLYLVDRPQNIFVSGIMAF